MTSYTATIELDADQAALLEQTADFMGLAVQALLDASLQSGIAHAEDIYLAELDRAQTEGYYLDEPEREVKTTDTAAAHRAGDMDDDLPF
jgi:hypothetical protein